MLNEYKKAIQELCRLQEEYDTLEIQASTVNRNKRRAIKDLRKAESEKEELAEKVKDRLIQEKKEAFNSIKCEADRIKDSMFDLKGTVEHELENIDLTEFNRKMDLVEDILFTLRDTSEFLNNKMPELVGRYEYPYDICIEELDDLANRCGNDGICKPIKSRVQILTDEEESSDGKSKFEEILDKIAGVPEGIDFQIKYRVMLCGCYLGVIVLAFLNLSFLVLGGIVFGFKVLYDKKKKEENKEKCIKYLENFKSMYQLLFKYMEEEKAKYIDEKKSEISVRYLEPMQSKKDEFDAKMNEYQQRISEVTVSDEEVALEVDREFTSRLEELQKAIDECELQKRKVLENQQKCEDELDKIQDKISQLRDSISEVYWELSSVGSEKVLMGEFFLGFKDYDLISVKHDGNAMCIVYDGESSERNSVLISMFIAQLFSNMLPNSLHLTIVDIDYTCRDYSIYNGKVFDLLFNYVTIEDDISKTIEELHSDLIKRQTEISPIADTIDDFNKMMIAKNSFTKDYRFLIFQNAKADYLKNQKLLQLCRTGKSFGIMPIIFISKQLYAGIETGSDSALVESRPVIESLKDYTWKFKQSTLDLEKI